jgi:hypothetical protein
MNSFHFVTKNSELSAGGRSQETKKVLKSGFIKRKMLLATL